MKALAIGAFAVPRRMIGREAAVDELNRVRRRYGASGARTALKVIGTLHRALYRWSNGRLGGRLRGGPVLLLTTTGRATGLERTWPLSYVCTGDDLVLIASAHGSQAQPAWYRNLRVHPLVRVQQGGTIQTMTSRVAQGTERTRLWEHVVAQYPVATGYQRNAGRELPLVLLRALDDEGAAAQRRLAA